MIKILTENGRILRFVMICQDFDQLFYPILNAVRISQDFDQLSLLYLNRVSIASEIKGLLLNNLQIESIWISNINAA